TSHFKKVHCLFGDGKNRRVFQRSQYYRIRGLKDLLLRALQTHILPKRGDFSSVPGLPGWSFQQFIYEGVLPSPSGRLSEPEALRIAPINRGPGFPPLRRCEKTAPPPPQTDLFAFG
ncbi:MAG: hypothetical protein ACQEQO_11660, partial [Thermodesulfobacteriota bacterium]